MIEPWQSDLDHLNWLSFSKIKSFAGKRILDLGCGSGYICEKAMSEGAQNAVGIDLVRPNISDDASWIFLERNLDLPNWNDEVGSDFDFILAFDILEHVESPFGFLKSCKDLLSDSGQLILTTPNLSSWERFVNPLNWSGVRDEQHKVLFNRYSLNFVLNRAGYSHVDLAAPIRKLSFLGPLQPHLGGQIFCKTSK